jgi:restriction endonuclease S subunit
MKAWATGGTFAEISKSKFCELRIPLPPLEIQKVIVAEIEGFQKVIDGARAVVENYKPQIPIDPEWPVLQLAELCESVTDGDHMPPPKAVSGVPFVTISNIDDQHRLDFTKTFFVPQSYYDMLNATRRPKRGDILYTVTGSYGIPVYIDFDKQFCFQRHIALVRPSDKVDGKFLYWTLASSSVMEQAHRLASGAAQKTVSLNMLRSFSISLPPISMQNYICAELEKEQAMVNSNRELIARFEKKIQAVMDRVWGNGTGE